MQTIKGRIKAEENKRPEKWTPVILYGIDNNGYDPELLGILTDNDGKWIALVCKMRGYSWYYNAYHPMQYAGVSVHIYRIESYTYDVEKGEYVFDVYSPFMEEFQRPRKK